MVKMFTGNSRMSLWGVQENTRCVIKMENSVMGSLWERRR